MDAPWQAGHAEAGHAVGDGLLAQQLGAGAVALAQLNVAPGLRRGETGGDFKGFTDAHIGLGQRSALGLTPFSRVLVVLVYAALMRTPTAISGACSGISKPRTSANCCASE